VLDVGCGIGRNLEHLRGTAVGVDHNAHSVAVARAQGWEAYTVEEFAATRWAAPGSVDTVLAAHLLEHLPAGEGERVLAAYLDLLRPGGRVVVICPQERGYRSDSTHLRWLDGPAIARLLAGLGLQVDRQLSFPFPRALGRWFTYNETVVTAHRAPASRG
jgi:SAM-dependent methyltransferase